MYIDFDFLNKSVEGAKKVASDKRSGLSERELLALSRSMPFGSGSVPSLLGIPHYYASKEFEDKLRKRRDQRKARDV